MARVGLLSTQGFLWSYAIDAIEFYVKVDWGDGDIFERLLFLKCLKIFDKIIFLGVCFCEC